MRIDNFSCLLRRHMLIGLETDEELRAVDHVLIGWSALLALDFLGTMVIRLTFKNRLSACHAIAQPMAGQIFSISKSLLRAGETFVRRCE